MKGNQWESNLAASKDSNRMNIHVHIVQYFLYFRIHILFSYDQAFRMTSVIVDQLFLELNTYNLIDLEA